MCFCQALPSTTQAVPASELGHWVCSNNEMEGAGKKHRDDLQETPKPWGVLLQYKSYEVTIWSHQGTVSENHQVHYGRFCKLC